MPRYEPWQPLLAGAQADEAWRTIHTIVDRVRHETWTDPSLATGAAGASMLFAYLDQVAPDRGYGEIAGRLIDHAIETVADRPMSIGFYSGFTGVAWVSEHITGSAQDAIDQPIESCLSGSGWDGEYDLISGLVGLAIWAIDALPRPRARSSLERVIEHLCRRARSTAVGVCWWTPVHHVPMHQRALYPDGYENLGVAHGEVAVLAVLSLAIASGTLSAALDARARESLVLGVHQFLDHQDMGGVSRWPAVVDGRSPTASTCRLAWCYGDVGIATALDVTADAAVRAGISDGATWKDVALATARWAAARAPSTSGVVDAGLCHGAAGIAHLFARLHQRTGDSRLRDAARSWFARTIALFTASSNGRDSAWLTGAPGIALALLGAVSAVSPDWDRALLGSARALSM